MSDTSGKAKVLTRIGRLVGVTLVVGLLWAPFTLEALTVAPARIEVNATPGETIRGELLLVNEQETEKTFYSSYANFEAQGETGTPNFVEAEEGLATWIETQESVTLEAGEQQEVPYTIRAPNNAEPGGHFAGIFWGTQPVGDAGESQVSVGAKVGALVLLSVAGDVEEDGGIVEFTTRDEQKWFTSPPVSFTYRFRNSGGDRIRPEGELVVRNTFGFVSERISANERAGNILPTSVRRFDVVWNNSREEDEGEAVAPDQPRGFFESARFQLSHFALGRYTANLTLAYGNGDTTDVATTAFYVFPWQLLLIVFIVLFMVFVLLRIIMKRYHRNILDQARREWEAREREQQL